MTVVGGGCCKPVLGVWLAASDAVAAAVAKDSKDAICTCITGQI